MSDQPSLFGSLSFTTQGGSREAEQTFLVTMVHQLTELLHRRQFSAEELLANSGLDSTALDRSGRVSLATVCGLVDRARLLTGEPGLGYFLALEKRASMYGVVGLAMSSASTVRDAIEVVVAYAPILYSTALTLDLRVEGDYAFLRLDENADFGTVRDVILISMMLGIETLARALTGRQHSSRIELAIPAPSYQARFAHLVPLWRFGQPANRLVLSASALNWPVLTADPVSFNLLRGLCEVELSQLGLDRRLVERVRRSIVRESGRFRSFDEVATDMGLSSRTLARRLVAQGASFSALVDQERQERALILLRTTNLQIQSVASSLGYASASTFVRAFRSWTGKTPAAYRREARRPPKGWRAK
jgi:AraC-like DNA-binding protein